MSDFVRNTKKKRYPGVKPFSDSEDNLFFGRERDIKALSTLIFVKQKVVLHGKSGFGKSSLISAGIIPWLKNSTSTIHFYIRFKNFSERASDIDQNLTPLETITTILNKQFGDKGSELLNSIYQNDNSFWYLIKQIQLVNDTSKFVFLFDQFEELFTYPAEQILEFSEQLSELLYIAVPPRLEKALAEAGRRLRNDEYDLLYEKPDVKVLFSIRSDRLSVINQLQNRHPDILQHCYELNALTKDDAKKAIREPARMNSDLQFESSTFEYTDEAIEKILASTIDKDFGNIDTPMLQIVCRDIEDTQIVINRIKIIDKENLGDTKDIYKRYYEGILNKLTNEERTKAQRLIEDELIDNGKRNTLSSTYISSKFGLSNNLLLILEQSSLLRKERSANGALLYEISHDSLVSEIIKVADVRKQKERKEQEEKERKRIEELRKKEEEKREEENRRLLDQIIKEQKINEELNIAKIAFSKANAQLEIQIKEKLKRNEQLNRARKMAWSISCLFIIVGCIAIFKYIQTIKLKKELVQNNEQLKAAERSRKEILSEKVSRTISDGMELEDKIHNYEAAITEYRNAQSLLLLIDENKNSSIYINIQNKIDSCLQKEH